MHLLGNQPLELQEELKYAYDCRTWDSLPKDLTETENEVRFSVTVLDAILCYLCGFVRFERGVHGVQYILRKSEGFIIMDNAMIFEELHGGLVGQ